MARLSRYSGCAVSALMMALAAGTAHAQLATQQGDRLDTRPPGPQTEAADAIRRGAAEASISFPIPSGRSISSVRVDGSSLSPAALEAATRGFIGSTIDAARLVALTSAVSSAYAKSNIALYSVMLPEQSFEGGEVRILALENEVDEVLLAGPGASRAGLTQAYAQEMAKEKPLTRGTFERYVLLMNDIPGVSVTPGVLAGDRTGAVKILLDRAAQQEIEGSFAVDSRGAERLGRVQARGDVVLNGFGYESSQTRLTAAGSTDLESFLSAGVTHSGTFTPAAITGSVSLGYYRTRPKDTAIEGEGYTAGVQLSHPLIRSSVTNVYIAGGIDGTDNENALVGQLETSDKTRAARAAVTASVQQGRTAFTVSGSLSQGIDGLGAEVADPTLSAVEFFKGNIRAGVTRTIGDRWRIAGSASAQMTDDILPAVELMSLGGGQFGRAFETGAVSGDSGVAASLELTRSVGQIGPVKASEVYGFVDGGKLWVNDRPGVVIDAFDVASAGAGVRVALSEFASLGVEVAYGADVAFEGVDEKEWRTSLSLGAAF